MKKMEIMKNQKYKLKICEITNRIIAGIIISLIILLSIELALRVFQISYEIEPKYKEADISLRDRSISNLYSRISDGRFYILRENEGREVNSDGFRGTSLNEFKNNDSLRILCLGDSTTFGVGRIESKNTYCSQLKKLIEEDKGLSVEIINAGVPGYTSFQGLNSLKIKFRDYTPDIVITYFGNNDASSLFHKEDKDIKVFPKALTKTYNFLENSMMYKNLRNIYLNKIYAKKYKLVKRVSVEDYRTNLLEIENITYTWGGKTFFISPVYLDNENITKAKKILRSMHIDKENTIYLESYFNLTKNMLTELFFDDCHPTIDGHKLIAKAIFEKIEPELDKKIQILNEN